MPMPGMTPYTPCLDCGRPLRGSSQSLEDYPDTLRHAGSGLCFTCKRSRQRQKTPVPDPVLDHYLAMRRRRLARQARAEARFHAMRATA